MRSRLAIVICSIAGAFLIYCTQSYVGDLDSGAGGGTEATRDGVAHPGHDGFVSDAHAANTNCCVPAPQKFVELQKGTVASGKPTAPVDVSKYRALVVYIIDVSNDDACVFNLSAQFRPNPTAPFGGTGQSVDLSVDSGARVRVDGTSFRLVENNKNCFVKYVIAGVH